MVLQLVPNSEAVTSALDVIVDHERSQCRHQHHARAGGHLPVSLTDDRIVANHQVTTW